MLSHTPMRRYAKEFTDKPVLIVGGKGQSCRNVARKYGFQKAYSPLDIMQWDRKIWPFSKRSSEDPAEQLPDFSNIYFEAIFVFHDSLDWGRDAQIITDLARSSNGNLLHPHHGPTADRKQMPIHFSNPDLIFRGGYSLPRFGQGAFQEAVKGVYKSIIGHDLISQTHGKPSSSTYDYATKLLQDQTGTVLDKTTTFMIGDNPASDIAGANSAGWQSILLETGVYSKEDGQPLHKPSWIANDVLEAVQGAFEQINEPL